MRILLAVRLAMLGSSMIAAGAVMGEAAPKTHARPKITGISHLAVYSSDMKATDFYYSVTIGAKREADPENAAGARYMINATQFVEVLPQPASIRDNQGVNRVDHTAWKTDDAENMRLYLAEKGWPTPAKVARYRDGSKGFRVDDPEGNIVEFIEPPKRAKDPDESRELGHHVIHVGFLVHSRAAEDKFYVDLLGFRPYWYGGMVDDKVDWVSQQAPESHDWLEYMLTSGPPGSGIPATISQQALGVLDHLSVGVESVPESYRKLVEQNRLTGRTDQHTQIGRDGKYQFNLYDPDGIRLELMEFHATDKPCCSPFTAEDPKAD